MMYDDFVRRVHKRRTNPYLSQQVQKCVDYIEMNLDKKYARRIWQRWWAIRNII